ncbi:CoA transferase [Achromobacter denitrificans]|uniref:CaiB/BaiF CoA transferase family protein n=1 Tax=Achromobacter denitrificans TaxID=32002 RepID=UPI000F66141A|nr:CoA transferase [Achromobacter denitrificans]MDX3879335.1 CoA transferase [Achromobacter sp.]MBV2161351.1 CoA transferase [Achromobacter denitrificans]MDF3941699.1 CoA transferase [Achromobacter denitrificans]MPT38707.1 CoA transferase [Achromobacter sp.]RSE79727.1 CoA transferase [Achromobacter denitrificans]
MDLRFGALTGIKVIDASRVLGGPYCGQILGDHGADVIKVEGPSGDDTRQWGPPDLGPNAAYFAGANRNKRSIVLDLQRVADRERFMEMLAEADVLIENFKPSTLRKWGWQADEFVARHPRLVHCRVSGFGPDGPYGGLPAYDTAIQAQCGLMSVNGSAESGPLRVGLPVVDMTTGLNAAIGVLLALRAREITGRGQSVETTLYANAISMLHPHASNFLGTGACPAPTGNAHPNIYPYDSFETSSASIYLAIGNDAQFRTLCRHLDLDALPLDPRYATNPARSIHRQSLRPVLESALLPVDGRELVGRLARDGVPAAIIGNVRDVLEDPQTRHMGLLVDLEPGYRGIASPIRLSDTPPTYRCPPPVFPGS